MYTEHSPLEVGSWKEKVEKACEGSPWLRLRLTIYSRSKEIKKGRRRTRTRTRQGEYGMYGENTHGIQK